MFARTTMLSHISLFTLHKKSLSVCQVAYKQCFFIASGFPTPIAITHTRSCRHCGTQWTSSDADGGGWQAACLARCNGAAVEVHAEAPGVAAFRAHAAAAAASEDRHVVVSYSRKEFLQTGALLLPLRLQSHL